MNNDYFEIKKVDRNYDDMKEKKQKAFLIRADIAFGVLSVLTTAVVSSAGLNPFTTYIKAFAVPLGAMILGNIKLLSIIKSEKAKQKKELETAKLKEELAARRK